LQHMLDFFKKKIPNVRTVALPYCNIDGEVISTGRNHLGDQDGGSIQFYFRYFQSLLSIL